MSAVVEAGTCSSVTLVEAGVGTTDLGVSVILVAAGVGTGCCTGGAGFVLLVAHGHETLSGPENFKQDLVAHNMKAVSCLSSANMTIESNLVSKFFSEFSRWLNMNELKDLQAAEAVETETKNKMQTTKFL